MTSRDAMPGPKTKASPECQQYVRWPNWIIQQRDSTTSLPGEPGRSSFLAGLRTGLRRIGLSLWLNVKIGAHGFFNVAVMTLPATGLWLFGWYSGWDNSFNKGYEQFSIGPSLWLLGTVLFIMAMLYVPIAQVGQAATGNWKVFYRFKEIRGLIRMRRLSCLVLAGLYSLAAFPITILKTAPQFFPISPETSDAQLLAFLNTYYFWMSLAGFLLFVFLRLVAGRIYASAVVEALRKGSLAKDALSEPERKILEPLGLLHVEEVPIEPLFLKVVRKSTWPIRRIVLGVAAIALWFTLVAQISISEFLNYHPVRGWLNQPLVQLPWFRYTPGHLTDSGGE